MKKEMYLFCVVCAFNSVAFFNEKKPLKKSFYMGCIIKYNYKIFDL